MQQIHGDIVSECPSTFSLLASSAISPVQAIASFYPDKPPPFTHSNSRTLPEEPWRNVHIIAFQGELALRTRPPSSMIFPLSRRPLLPFSSTSISQVTPNGTRTSSFLSSTTTRRTARSPASLPRERERERGLLTTEYESVRSSLGFSVLPDGLYVR